MEQPAISSFRPRWTETGLFPASEPVDTVLRRMESLREANTRNGPNRRVQNQTDADRRTN